VWGTYYGGKSAENDARVSIGGINIFLGGSTNSDTGIATPGTHQTTLGSINGDAYLAAFDSSGKRLWGSYFGGENIEIFGGISGVQEGAIYLSGKTQSLTNIASTGADKTSLSGVEDAFLVKFKTDGTREWSTYVGGENLENAGDRIARDQLGNVFLYGLTGSTTGISSGHAWQKIYGGGKTDHFISCFDPNGKKIWGSYMGGEEEEGNVYRISGCSYINNSLYISGTTKSHSGIATSGSFKPTFAGAYGGFLARIKEPIPTTGSIASKSEIGQTTLTVYPNPGSGNFTLNMQCSNYNGIVEIQILNMAGKVIQRMENQMLQGALTKEIKLFESFPQGVYLVKTIIEGKTNTQRIIKR
ncbi:MAG: T9SS type A sorting domain-containing protein, partial [Chitinophagaceae bacterium]|nr:T9SS type A sorting domain-containing protein [Chitinophagaceae bacterium]